MQNPLSLHQKSSRNSRSASIKSLRAIPAWPPPKTSAQSPLSLRRNLRAKPSQSPPKPPHKTRSAFRQAPGMLPWEALSGYGDETQGFWRPARRQNSRLQKLIGMSSRPGFPGQHPRGPAKFLPGFCTIPSGVLPIKFLPNYTSL